MTKKKLQLVTLKPDIIPESKEQDTYSRVSHRVRSDISLLTINKEKERERERDGIYVPDRSGISVRYLQEVFSYWMDVLIHDSCYCTRVLLSEGSQWGTSGV